ncbi:MAG: tetratricopeptide repeat protein [Desulfococcaceae bacterium]
MNTYVGLVALGIIGVGISSSLPFLIPNPAISFITVILASVFTLLITFMVTKKWMEDGFQMKTLKLKEENERRISHIKKEHDTTTLEKTIRDGTQTLIKNALDYFKIENIKNEIGTSAAIENLQLDKYGQIIELLADFSLILPDIKENKKIVEEEIVHQIQIYRIDENPFALFLERIMKKYNVTVEKKIREKIDQEISEKMRRCPQCAERIMPQAKVCKHCGFELRPASRKVITLNPMERGKKFYKLGRYEDAIREFDTVIREKTDDPEAYFNRAIVYNKMGKFRMAKSDLEEASQRGHEKARELLNIKSETAKNR